MCPMLHFIQFLNDKEANERTQWQLPYYCLNSDQLGETVSLARNSLTEMHFNFLLKFLANCSSDHQVVQLLWQKVGTFVPLQKLLGDTYLYKLWNHQEIREKLLNRKCKNVIVLILVTVFKDFKKLFNVKFAKVKKLTFYRGFS